jgi:autoinducer 2-degrading protein
MFGKRVVLEIKSEFTEAFIAASRANAEGTWQEPGNVRFDLVQSVDDPNIFTLFEVFVSEEASDAHLASAHFAAWREATGDMLVSRQVYRFTPIFLKE